MQDNLKWIREAGRHELVVGSQVSIFFPSKFWKSRVLFLSFIQRECQEWSALFIYNKAKKFAVLKTILNW